MPSEPEEISYVLPIRCDGNCGGHPDLGQMLRRLHDRGVEVIVADGSPASVLSGPHGSSFAGFRRVSVGRIAANWNGKVAGVHAGVLAATHERIVLADDDVLYDVPTLVAVASLLDEADLGVPQNFFESPHRWHALWDTGRMMLNRAFAHDFPSTFALRRSMFVRMGGYDGDVLFENLELIRTVEAARGRIAWAPNLFVPRFPPTRATFARQRIRQAYDSFAQPTRLAAELCLAPAIAWGIARHRRVLTGGILTVVVAAEVGRRKRGGKRKFPILASLLAPGWVLERSVCVWGAVGLRLIKGGVRYRDGRLQRAGSSKRELRCRQGDSHCASLSCSVTGRLHTRFPHRHSGIRSVESRSRVHLHR